MIHRVTSTKETFKPQTTAENEKAYILEGLNHVKGKIAGKGGAAELLGLPPGTLTSRIKKLGIQKKHYG